MQGFVISDWEALDRLSNPRGSNYRYCVSVAVNAGIDMVVRVIMSELNLTPPIMSLKNAFSRSYLQIMVPFKYGEFTDDLLALVESGEVPLARIDDAVERILRVKFVAGLFEHPFSDRSLLSFVGCKVNMNGSIV